MKHHKNDLKFLWVYQGFRNIFLIYITLKIDLQNFIQGLNT